MAAIDKAIRSSLELRSKKELIEHFITENEKEIAEEKQDEKTREN